MERTYLASVGPLLSQKQGENRGILLAREHVIFGKQNWIGRFRSRFRSLPGSLRQCGKFEKTSASNLIAATGDKYAMFVKLSSNALKK